MTTKKMMDAYNERQKKQVSKSENTNLNTNKSGGKSPARLAAEAKKAKLMSEVGTNKTNTKSVLGVTDFKNKAKTDNKDMKGGNRDPQSIPGKNKALMSKIAGGSKGTFSIPKSGPKTIPGKNAAKMSEIAGNSPMGKGGQGSTMAKKAAPKKNPIVTPKMLKDAGFPNNAGGLRDYMNFKSGKTRKGGGKAVRTEAFKKKNPSGIMGDSFKGGGKVKKMMGGGMTKGKMMKYRGGGMVSKSRPTKYI